MGHKPVIVAVIAAGQFIVEAVEKMHLAGIDRLPDAYLAFEQNRHQRIDLAEVADRHNQPRPGTYLSGVDARKQPLIGSKHIEGMHQSDEGRCIQPAVCGHDHTGIFVPGCREIELDKLIIDCGCDLQVC